MRLIISTPIRHTRTGSLFPERDATAGVKSHRAPRIRSTDLSPSSKPRIAVADLSVATPDGTFPIGLDGLPRIEQMRALGMQIQSDRVREAHPPDRYVEVALLALTEACIELGVPEAFVAFVETVESPTPVGLRSGLQGGFTTDFPNLVWIFVNWTSIDELRRVMRHEAAHLAFARTHTPEESAGHSGPSEVFALAFEAEPR
jgi:hypothetical protein